MDLPILYSFRRCPYAIRARIAIYQANIKCELREVVLNDKPDAMLALSAKGTVPVLQTTNGEVIEQSLDVMLWALRQHDPDDWLSGYNDDAKTLIDENDGHFKHYLDRYKYHVAYPEHSSEYYRDKASLFLQTLEESLQSNPSGFLSGNKLGLLDVAIFPFVRQFANVDIDWFRKSSFQRVINWYGQIASMDLFQHCMDKYEQWQQGNAVVYFPA